MAVIVVVVVVIIVVAIAIIIVVVVVDIVYMLLLKFGNEYDWGMTISEIDHFQWGSFKCTQW